MDKAWWLAQQSPESWLGGSDRAWVAFCQGASPHASLGCHPLPLCRYCVVLATGEGEKYAEGYEAFLAFAVANTKETLRFVHIYGDNQPDFVRTLLQGDAWLQAKSAVSVVSPPPSLPPGLPTPQTPPPPGVWGTPKQDPGGPRLHGVGGCVLDGGASLHCWGGSSGSAHSWETSMTPPSQPRGSL